MKRPKYNLEGVDGNAYSIMGYVRTAMRREGYSRQQVESYTKEATKSDYSNLIRVSSDMVDELNSKAL